MNAIQTKHNLDFEARQWHRDKRVMEFKVGTCHGLYNFQGGRMVIISIVNDSPGNGHLEDVFEWFEFAAKAQGVDLMIAEFMNDRFKKHCIEKRGYKPLGSENVIKKFSLL